MNKKFDTILQHVIRGWVRPSVHLSVHSLVCLLICPSRSSWKHEKHAFMMLQLYCVFVCVGGGFGFGWGWELDSPAYPSATILWPRVSCFIFFSIYGWLLHYCSSPNAWLVFGQRPRRGRCPVGDFRSFIFPSVCASPPPWLKSQSQGSNPSLMAQILDWRLKFHPQGSNPKLQAQIPVSRLKSQSPGSYPSLQALILALKFK